jgi:SAM-dependent methyltransferase
MEGNVMTQPDQYLLGRSKAEEARLKRQIAELAPVSDAQLERVGIQAGERVVDIGCGPGGVLDLLAKRVGSTGAVLGIDRSTRFVGLARRFVEDLSLAQVKVQEADAYDTGLPRGAFDGAHMRLVLVNVPEPERVVREMVSLVRPGGWIASLEAEVLENVFDPPLPEFTRLHDAYAAYSASQKIDLGVGRRIHRLFRAAGVTDIHVDVVVQVYPLGNDRRSTRRDFINNVRDKMIEGGFIDRDELDAALTALERHVANPETQVVSSPYYRLCGRVPKR